MLPAIKSAGAAALGAVLLAGCQLGPTPYQSAGPNQAGYTDTRIETDRFKVSFRGNSSTDKDTVETYLLYRAAELTLQNGFDHFTIVDRDTDKRTQYNTDFGPAFGPSFGYGFRHAYFSPRFGWVGAYDPFWTPTRVSEITRYEASAEIKLGRGAKGPDPASFDARDVSKNLASRIARPES
ncbi:hypothetical protein GC169_10050 [bacterium]|nr:hypothetical protein [bacterium]